MKILLTLIFLCASAFAENTYVHPEVVAAMAENTIQIHPEMRDAIEENEGILRSGEELPPDEWIEVDGVKRHIGFRPTWGFYRGAKVINVKADPALLAKFKNGFNHKEKSFSPVRGQIWGSCWAEGAGSAFELNWNLVRGTKDIFSVQDIIDCSGFGSARNGGQLSLEYALGGLAMEKDYPYNGKDNRCKKDIERHLPLKQVAILRGANGGFPTEAELLTAYFTYGAMEVCGSASSLRGGGRVDNPGTGRTNHCYAYGAAFPGKEKGWLDAWYHGMKNSWGDGSNSDLNLSGGDWGDGGWGYYKLGDGNGKIRSSVITEIMIGYAGPVQPPEPFTFEVTAGNWKFEVTVDPKLAPWTEDELKAEFLAAFK